MALFGKKKEAAAENCDCGGGCCGSIDAESMAEAKKAQGEGALVKVLGSGCKKCNQLEENTVAALKQLGMDTGIEHVTDFAQIDAWGVMTTPALVVDGKVVLYGKVAKTEEIVTLLQKARG
mgnify:CR=1 FL=1